MRNVNLHKKTEKNTLSQGGVVAQWEGGSLLFPYGWKNVTASFHFQNDNSSQKLTKTPNKMYRARASGSAQPLLNHLLNWGVSVPTNQSNSLVSDILKLLRPPRQTVKRFITSHIIQTDRAPLKAIINGYTDPKKRHECEYQKRFPLGV